ncbi:hypothetical protein [Streptomyces purpureus]|uniref:Lipoprotein n=1 Tax=Streptomyces purpureus TaxID=1951 RepID=A0A918GZL3_9ACTN|nr:hypothetical protein [Streptomyces purpureus]GGT22238.1 hypothetical protein GCM10014713_14080 [Streptomyces purpureus]
MSNLYAYGWRAAGVTVGVLALTGALSACGATGGGAAERSSGGTWAPGITPKWMSEQMGLAVPATAGSPQAAYEITSQFDKGLLTFTLTKPEAEAYLMENRPSGKWLEPTAAQTVKPHDFAHLGLPEPETFKDGIRYGYVCPDAPKTPEPPTSTSDDRCVRLYAPEHTRIYLRAHFEPGISPLPTPPSTPAG